MKRKITQSPGTTDDPKPPPPKRAAEAVVRCKGIQCMAYRDKDGVWRSVADDRELEVLEVVLRF